MIKDLYPKCTNDSYNSTTTNNFDLKLGKRSHQRSEKMANTHMKRCLIPYVIKEFQIKAKTRYYNTSIRKMKWKLLSPFWLFATPRTIVHQAPLSMGFSRQEYWSGLPFPSPGDLPDPGIAPRFPALEADSLLSELPGKPTEAGHKLKRQSSLLLKDKLLENAKRI